MSAEPLVVWLGETPVGDLARIDHGRRIRFERRPGTVTLTVAAEGADERWTPSLTRAWFDGLLPEESRRTVAEVEHGVERGDTFGLLAAIGWECAGAVSVLPEGRRPASGSYRDLSDDQVWERLDALPRTVAEEDRDVRLSLGGAQEKLLLARLDRTWRLPLDGAISTHILKPEPERYPGLAAGEAWSLAVASAATETAVAQVTAPEGHRPTIVVERYDRRVLDGSVTRVHQEDGCQVLGLAPEQKYPRGTEPREASLGRIARVLVARAEDPLRELRRLLTQTVVNVALLNTDAHAKNLSLVHGMAGTVTLSPMYDVVPAAWFVPAQSRAALPIGGKWRVTEVERHHLVDEAVSWGMPDQEARGVVSATLTAIEQGVAAATARYPAAPEPMRAAVSAQIRRLAVSP